MGGKKRNPGMIEEMGLEEIRDLALTYANQTQHFDWQQATNAWSPDIKAQASQQHALDAQMRSQGPYQDWRGLSAINQNISNAHSDYYPWGYSRTAKDALTIGNMQGVACISCSSWSDVVTDYTAAINSKVPVKYYHCNQCGTDFCKRLFTDEIEEIIVTLRERVDGFKLE